MTNLNEVLRNEINENNGLEVAMFEILESNIDGIEIEEVKNYMENEAICNTGSVNGLIYYGETKAIFKEYFEEILGLVEEYKVEFGENPAIDFNYNSLVWFAFEYLNNKWFNSIDWDELEEEVSEEEVSEEE